MEPEATKEKQKHRELTDELGKLTYERAKLVKELNENAKRANKIGDELERLDNGG